ncbi:hypothetical protein BUALT_Bualt19G0047200 [Buddleja alternifolia]|uniref:BRCT domain-containing protein n=1 Tax=Buddleja alternifolia TaxID=168488 RepID=A0AAV6W760_9LAMI|nr:hypothetical protein BUALT_Bualt19G0047200 [Buddleja alternifolia]
MATKVFTGANVFMSRNLVPPELFDALHDALKLNGAQVLLCCDPSRNAPNDYHVIASPEHEKFEDLRSKGCNLLGPQCVLSCAKEHRLLPNHGFTCCLAMDGVNILASGFEKDEKADIAKMVTAMGGVLHTKASSDVSFVIVKNVLAQKYKWALNNLKKPIVTLNWLRQCWKEHRVVSQESYRVLPFSGLTICVSGIPADERKEMEKLVIQNGGKYSAELTKKCTHLICDISLFFHYRSGFKITHWHSGVFFCINLILLYNALTYYLRQLTFVAIAFYPHNMLDIGILNFSYTPEGDKYKVAKRWGHIYIITRKWFHQSIARRACLSEESYPVQNSLTSSVSTLKTVEHHSQGKGIRNSQYTSSSLATASDSEINFSAQATEPDLENPLPNMYPTFFEAPPLSQKGNNSPADQQKVDSAFARCVADDSQSDDDDLYLSECRILLVGFEASELRKLVDMVRRGGGSRYMSFSEKLTHVIVGNPSEIEIKEVRSLAAFGVIYVVKTAWLEECNSEKKEVAVLPRHIAYDVLLPKDPVYFNRTTATSMSGMKQWKSLASQPLADGNIREGKNSQSEVLLEEAKLKSQSCASNGNKHTKPLSVFKGKLFRFSSSFPEEQRPEIVLWVNEGGGEVVTDQNEKNVHFIVERHGVVPCLTDIDRSTCVSTHWIRSCLQDGRLLDVGSHVLYSPLPCRIPLPGFEGYRLCVSQYDMKERQLLRNLCYVLGVKFTEKFTKKATHLLCKFADGDKYDAACRWGIQIVTAEWIYECAMQNKVVDLKRFSPREVTSQDREAGLCPVTQYSTQSDRVISVNDASQQLSQSWGLRNMQAVDVTRDEDNYSNSSSKRTRFVGNDSIKHHPSCDSNNDNSVHKEDSAEKNVNEHTRGVSSVVPDVAAAIEDLLEQTSKIQDRKSLETSGCHENSKLLPPKVILDYEQFLSSNSTMLGQRNADPQSDPGLSKHWINRLDKRDDNSSAEADTRGIYDGFSETQTDSQVVGYEEDLSGRQMIIDRVRTRSSMA